jgi:hypothetical protein
VRSANRPIAALGLGLAAGSVAAGVALSGCQTTQEAAARIHVRSARELASREKLDLGKPSQTVEVADVTLLESDGRQAVAVELRNTGSEPAHDLPLAVGVRDSNGDRVYLNREHGPYFQSHIPALGAGERATWVYTDKDLVQGAHDAFAEVGADPSAAVDRPPSLPALDLSAVQPTAGNPDRIRFDVSNPTELPQYDLDTYAWATKAGQVVAAGRASAGDLEPDETEPVSLSLVGAPKGAELHVSAPPTIFE